MSSHLDASSTAEPEVVELDDSTDDEGPFDDFQPNKTILLPRDLQAPLGPLELPPVLRRFLEPSRQPPQPRPPPPAEHATSEPIWRRLTKADLLRGDSEARDTIQDVVKGLISHGRLSEGANAALQKLSDEFVRGMLTEEFARECSKAGVPVCHGAEAEKAGHIRLLFHVYAIPHALLAKYAPTWALFMRMAEEEGLGSRAVIQEMVSNSKAAVLLPHCDPHAKHQAKPGSQCEAMVSLPCSEAAQQFVIATSKKTVPTIDARFGSRGHGVKANFQDLDPGKLNITREPREVLAVDDRVLGGHATFNGLPLLHTGNPTKQGSPTVRPTPDPRAQNRLGSHPPQPCIGCQVTILLRSGHDVETTTELVWHGTPCPDLPASPPPPTPSSPTNPSTNLSCHIAVKF